MEEQRPGTLEKTEMFAGTSDGAFMTLYLAARLAEGNMEPLEMIDGCIEFSNRLCEVLHATFGRTLRLLLGGPLNLSRDLRDLLSRPEIYGDLTLGDLDRMMLVVTFDAFNWRPCMLRSFDPMARPEITLVDAALASSAFPMLLPLHNGGDGNFYLDGGVVANNPAMGALSSGLQYLRWTEAQDDENGESDHLRQMTVFSLGSHVSKSERTTVTGKIRKGLLEMLIAIDPWGVPGAPGDMNWGWTQWILRPPAFLTDLLLQGSVAQTSFECRQLLGRRFHRYTPPLSQLQEAATAFFRDRAPLSQDLDEQAASLCGQTGMSETLTWLESEWLVE
ncbi:MAG: hypothetical protein EXR72_14850 [Myxococcales bacterium]|nr:hypothetical protein [Myxococcales bacterium]